MPACFSFSTPLGAPDIEIKDNRDPQGEFDPFGYCSSVGGPGVYRYSYTIKNLNEAVYLAFDLNIGSSCCGVVSFLNTGAGACGNPYMKPPSCIGSSWALIVRQLDLINNTKNGDRQQCPEYVWQSAVCRGTNSSIADALKSSEAVKHRGYQFDQSTKKFEVGYQPGLNYPSNPGRLSILVNICIFSCPPSPSPAPAPAPAPAPEPASTPAPPEPAPIYNIWTWGTNWTNEIGDGVNSTQIATRSSPVQVQSDKNWTDVSSGTGFKLALDDNGYLYGWGQLFGIENTTSTITSIPLAFPTGIKWRKISAGGNHWNAIATTAVLYTAGANYVGECGLNNTNLVYTPSIVKVDIADVASGSAYTLAVDVFGKLWSWGANDLGQLGDSTTQGRSSPVQIGSDTTWSQVAAGAGFTSAAIKTDGSLWLWGRNQFGQIGDETTVNKSSPVNVAVTTGPWNQVAVGYGHVAAINTSRQLWCWGDNSKGQCGRPVVTQSYSSPVQTQVGGYNWNTISAGVEWTGATKVDGTLWNWGYGTYGSLGNNQDISYDSPIETVAGGSGWAKVSGFSYGVAGLRLEGTSPTPPTPTPTPTSTPTPSNIWGSGYNQYGQLGDGTIFDRSSPVQNIVSGNTWTGISGGGAHAGAIYQDGSLWMWGLNSSAQLGGAYVGNLTISPVQINTGAAKWSSVSCGGYHTVALGEDQSIWTWGYNYFGQCGNGYTTNVLVTTILDTDYDWSKISAGATFSAAIKASDKTLWLWGNNDSGQLGDGTTTSRSSPVQEFFSYEWSQVSCGYNHAAAIAYPSNELYLWGNNFNGQLGIITTVLEVLVI